MVEEFFNLNVEYIKGNDFQISVEIPDKLIKAYSKEVIAMGLMCVVDNWVKEELDLLEEENNDEKE